MCSQVESRGLNHFPLKWSCMCFIDRFWPIWGCCLGTWPWKCWPRRGYSVYFVFQELRLHGYRENACLRATLILFYFIYDARAADSVLQAIKNNLNPHLLCLQVLWYRSWKSVTKNQDQSLLFNCNLCPHPFHKDEGIQQFILNFPKTIILHN